ncbi:rifamycin polyketide synthase [Streptomyces malaysiensis]|uniref:Rifamycin polyketide synthase n=1 Tax=Streptomyces malaysiensis TaxID=92644 RepID=A0A7X5X1V8_STRMQ|nr:rifamycin polyketide synthase [Streptomyces malaysiensis]
MTYRELERRTARLAGHLAGLVGVLGLSERDRVLWPLPLHHAMSRVVCFLGVTAVGASAVLLPRFSVAGVLGELRCGDGSFTLLGGVPTTYSALLDAVRVEADGKEGGKDGAGLGAPALRGCISGGAAAGPGFRESFEAVCRVPLSGALRQHGGGPGHHGGAGRGDGGRGMLAGCCPAPGSGSAGAPTAGSRARASCGSAGPGSWPVSTAGRTPPRRYCATAGSARATWPGSTPPVNW